MTERFSTMGGDVHTRLTATSLAIRLSIAGIKVHVRRWNDPDASPYIQVLECDDFILSRDSTNGYLADAVSASVRRMRSAACQVSAVLTDLKIRHRFHVCSGQYRHVEYLHHRWPKESVSRSLI
jgi:hypothetical protein